MNTKLITAFAPATVANVGCGFDIMGFAIEGTGDKVTVSLDSNSHDDNVSITGKFAHLIPIQRKKNTASVAVDTFLKATGNEKQKISVSLEKNMPLGSGMGSSASSSAAAVFAVNALFDYPLSTSELIPFAMEGERVACGAAHADNVAPSLLGGFVLIRSYFPLDIISIPCPEDLFCVVIHPQIELQTADSRRVLRKEVSLQNAIRQTASAAGLMVGLLQENYKLIGLSISDVLAEPQRTQLIPGFDIAKEKAFKFGALGFGISGSGPSVFALCKGLKTAKEIASEIQNSFLMVDLHSDMFVSKMNASGAYVVNE